MPVGPSHGGGSHSSSSSSHSSSSSSYSSSSSSSSSSSNYSSSSSGGGYYVSHSYSHGYYDDRYGGYSSYHKPMSAKTKKTIWLVLAVIFCTIFTVIFALLFINNEGPSSLMRKDAREYAQIIERANNHEPGYFLVTINDIQKTGESGYGNSITYTLNGDHASVFHAIYEVKKDGVYYFYFTYSFTDDYGRNLSGESYTSYSESAVKSLSSMTLAYTLEYDMDGSWDIIDINYSLASNMDYWAVHSKVIRGVIGGLVTLGLDALFIYLIVRVHMVKEPSVEDGTSKNATVKTNEADEYERIVCEFCGTPVGKNKNKCESCGSTKFKVVKLKREQKEK